MSTTAIPTQPLTDHSPMPFGKHRGKAMVNVPAPYLLWLYNSCCDHAQVRKYIIDNLDSLIKEAGHTKR